MVAIVAAGVAVNQLAEARKARETATKDAYDLQAQTNKDARNLQLEAIQPYVMMYMERSGASDRLVDLVAKNFGQTAATNVRVSFEPHPQRSSQGQQPPEDVRWPDAIPTLAPGQEHRVLWDSGLARLGSENPTHGELPDRHEVTVTYSDAHGTALTSTAILDWSVYKQRRWAPVKTLHNLAESVDTLSKTVESFREGINGGLAVVVRDGDAKDRAETQRIEELQRNPPALAKLVEAATAPSPVDPETGDDRP